MSEILISIDLEADFGFFRKPDTNEGIVLSFNMLHKPALLGIMGAILGYNGYQKRGILPEYYQKLKHLKIGIKPLADHKGTFAKTAIWYTNTVGYANKDGNLLLQENVLIKPAYRVFIKLENTHPLLEKVKRGEAEFLPYFGKNECPLWWHHYQEYDSQAFQYTQDYRIDTLFMKTPATLPASMLSADTFLYFERLPVGFNEFTTKRGIEYQYNFKEFAYTNAWMRKENTMPGLFEIDEGMVIQLF